MANLLLPLEEDTSAPVVVERETPSTGRNLLLPPDGRPFVPGPTVEVFKRSKGPERTQIRIGDTPVMDFTPTVERFKAGVDIGTRGAQSLAQVPILGRLMNLPATAVEAVTGEPSPSLRIEPKPILPEIPTSVPPGMGRAILEGGRAFLDPVVGAGAAV